MDRAKALSGRNVGNAERRLARRLAEIMTSALLPLIID
jgi:hypothetical protein